ncbi:four helix bundle protein [Candidatus Saccharibacteria bacterium]|nr:MAG: four helix bundle protein [Candidatus Saccharibacteria bacterium]
MGSERKKAVKFTDLEAWQHGHQLVIAIYKQTRGWPSSEQFGLVSQIRRAAVSVTSNIAEGFSRATKTDKSHFYVMAHSSLTEVQNQLLVARDVGFLSKTDFEKMADSTVTVHKLLTGLIKSLKG